MIAKSADSPRNLRRRLRRRIAQCRDAVQDLRVQAAVEPWRAVELLALANETASLADWAEQLLTDAT